MKIGLVAHDNRKEDLIHWVEYNADHLAKHELICTGTTGKLVIDSLNVKNVTSIKVKRLKSGPLGGDQELGSLICNDEIDILIFLWNDVKFNDGFQLIFVVLKHFRAKVVAISVSHALAVDDHFHAVSSFD